MKLLILTQYFPPEVGAPQNRLYELAIRLKKEGVDITVLTAMPNYPKGELFPGYENKAYSYEEIDGLKIHRTSIYPTKSKSIVKRLRNYFSFVYSSYFTGKNKLEDKYDYLLCESPPLFLGISGYLISKNIKAKLIFNVSDLWPESAEKLGLVKNKLFLWLAYKLEAFLYKKSVLVTGQTQGIVKSIQTRFPLVKTYWLPNGVDLELYNPDKISSNWRQFNGFSDDDVLVLYAGILGHAQGLEVILKAANKTKELTEFHYIILGSGPLREDLIALKNQYQLNQVHFFDVVSKSEMPKIISAVDIALVPLKRLDLFKGAIPSKIFENLAMKKMLLLGVEGEAKELFIDKGKAGLFFTPEDENDLADKIFNLAKNTSDMKQYGENGRAYVDRYFNRTTIAAAFHKELYKLEKKEK